MTDSKKKQLITITISLLAALTFLKTLSATTSRNIDELGGGFGEATALDQKHSICKADEVECIRRISKIFQPKSNDNTLLVLGNSQLGAINQMKESDMSYAQLISEDPNLQKYVTRSIWIPNANLKEFHVIYQALSDCGSEPKFLAIPVFLDDTREGDVRESVKKSKSSLCPISEEDEKIEPANEVKHSKNFSETLSESLVRNLPVFSDLSRVNGTFRVWLYQLRNTIFGISASSKRKVIPNLYKTNLSSLEALINKRNSLGKRTFLYIPPLLYSSTKPAMIPYVETEYASFKKDVDLLCARPHCRVANLEGLVPDEDWGSKASTILGSEKKEIDFMHFTSRGHERLAKELRQQFKVHF